MMTENNKQDVWKFRFRSSLLKIALVMISIVWLVIVAASWAESAEREPASDSVSSSSHVTPIEDQSDEYNFNWLDPEKKIYVLQNRRYLKAAHWMPSLMGGVGLSNSYRSVLSVDPRLAYYFSEAFGLEGFYTFSFNSVNNTYKALQQTSPTTLPITREFKNEMGLMAQWVPWYAKINVFNKIIYFDWYFAGGAGELDTRLVSQANTTAPQTYVDQKLFALYAGTGHLYHLSSDLTVRIDFTGSFYKSPLQGNVGESTWFSSYNFEVGFGYRL